MAIFAPKTKNAACVWHTWPLLRTRFWGWVRDRKLTGVQCRSKLTSSPGTPPGAVPKGSEKDTSECCGGEYTPFTEEIGSYEILSSDVSEEELRSLAAKLRKARLFSVNQRL